MFRRSFAVMACLVVLFCVTAVAARRRSVRTGPRSVRVQAIPSGAQIIYHRDQLFYAMNGEGQNPVQITFEDPHPWEHVAVSYDRRYLAANEQLPNPNGQPGGVSRLWLFDLQAGTQTPLVPHFMTAGNGGVDWDPAGFIYFGAKEKDIVENPTSPDDFRANAGANDIYRIRPNGSGLQRILSTPDKGEADISVSADGSLVAFVSQPLDADHTEIWVAGVDGSDPRRVYRAGRVRVASAHDPELSPDNSKLVFSITNSAVPPNFPDNPAANTAHDIWSINIDGSELRRLTRPGPISITPDWRGDEIVYLDISEADRWAGASVVNARDLEQQPLRIREHANIPKWIP